MITTLSGFIILLLVLIILVVFYTKFLPLLMAKADREICRASVIAQSALNILPEGEKLIEPDCMTNKIVFFEDHVEINDKTKRIYDPVKKQMVKKFDSLSDDLVNSVITEELRWCWYQFLEGKKDLFNLKDFFPWSSQRACFLCSEITFSKSVKNDRFEGFFQFTKDTTMPDSEMSYYEYYAEESRRHSIYYNQKLNKNAWEEYTDGMKALIKLIDAKACGDYFYFVIGENRPEINREISFNTTFGKKYVVYFVREGTGSKPRETQEIINKIRGQSPPQGCAPETYFAYVLPSDELKNQCSILRRGSMK